MIPLTEEELSRWRAEIDLGVVFRDKEFGTYRQQQPGSPPTTTLAGRNLEAYEQGARSDGEEPPLNLVFPIVKTIVPTLYYQNPRALALPDSKEPDADEDAFYVSELVNRDLRDVDFRFKETSQQAVFDAYVLGYGVVKIGYATRFGQDVLRTPPEERQRLRDRIKAQVDGVLEQIGLKEAKPEEPEPDQVQPDLTIRSESAYVQWIDPFDFVVDPAARDLTDARWVAQRVRRILAEVKRDRRYGRSKHALRAETIESEVPVPSTFIEEFQTVDVWEVHYKSLESPTGIRVLTFASTQHQTQALLHEDNPYDLGGWQYEWLTPNKHGHRLYPISSLSVARPLLDRINSSFDAVIDQLDKFIAKVVYNERVTTEGQAALDSGQIGARIKVSGEGDVRGALAVVSMDQFNAEVSRFLDYAMDFFILIVGLTRAQLTGLTTAQTATEAQIGQSGQNIRRTDESSVVAVWTNRVVAKMWRAKAQFQSFQDVALINGESVVNPETGIGSTQWYPPIDEARERRLKANRFGLHIEVSSIQKPNLEIVRAQFIEIVKGLVEPAITQGLALEGKRLQVSEILRQMGRFFTEQGLDQAFERIVVPIQDESLRQTLLNYGQAAGTAGGNGQARGLTGAVPNLADQISAVAGEKGQGASPV